MSYKISARTLKIRQGLPLDAKITFSERRIKEYYEKFYGQVYVSFSGGKDSTVLLNLVRGLYPDVPAVFVDTGLEYPEIRDFVKTIKNVAWLKPKYTFKQVIEKYGYPIPTKVQAQYIHDYKHAKSQKTKDNRWNGVGPNKKFKISEKWKFLVDAPFKVSDRCCKYLKKEPARKYEKKTGLHQIVGIMAEDSNNRGLEYQRSGCNAFNKKPSRSWPLAVWTTEDIWEYIKRFNLSYAKIYDSGMSKTGCMFCMFGMHMKKVNRFKVLKELHPKLWEYCIYSLGIGKVLDYCNMEYGLKEI